MSSSAPPPESSVPASTPASVAARSISLRKVILGIVLAGAIVVFCLLLFAGVIATLREAAPHGHAGLTRFFLLVKRIAHHLQLR